jgi:hypothetical protein
VGPADHAGPPGRAERRDVLIAEAATGALLAAGLASLGYVVRLLVQERRERGERRAARLSRLMALDALLRASGAAFHVQKSLARSLAAGLRGAGPPPSGDSGLETLIASRHADLTPEQVELHRVVRGYTEHALRPINERMSAWLREDTEHRGYVPRRQARGATTDPRADLVESLAALEAHLVLWHAKYEAWLPGRPEHALVYLDDEKRHGLGFPQTVERDVRAVIALESGRRTPAH